MTIKDLRKAITSEQKQRRHDWTRQNDAERIVTATRISEYGLMPTSKRVNIKQVYWYLASHQPEQCRAIFGAIVPYKGCILPNGMIV